LITRRGGVREETRVASLDIGVLGRFILVRMGVLASLGRKVYLILPEGGSKRKDEREKVGNNCNEIKGGFAQLSVLAHSPLIGLCCKSECFKQNT